MRLVPLLLVLAACSMAAPVASHTGGIGRDEAILLAQRHADPTAVFVSAQSARDSDVVPLDQRPKPVWLVYFTGSWPGECPPGEGPGPAECPDFHRATIALDLETGAFVGASYQP